MPGGGLEFYSNLILNREAPPPKGERERMREMKEIRKR